MFKLVKDMLSSDFAGPAYLIHYLINKCNACCAHCFIFRKTISGCYLGKESSLEEIKKIAASFSPALCHVNLAGGRPFLRSDLVEIVNLYIREAKVCSIQITTNNSLSFKIRDDILRMF